MSINPKSISLEELYGCYNPLSLEWKIGVLAKILQTYSHHTEMEIQTSNKTAPENGGKNTDETATEAGSSSAVDYSESSTELLDHQLGLSHSTIGDNGGEDSFSERVPNDSPTGVYRVIEFSVGSLSLCSINVVIICHSLVTCGQMKTHYTKQLLSTFTYSINLLQACPIRHVHQLDGSG